ncbi:UbiH/UbiF/VisC/COQ6 family ubiquinone biosynthesis hydroxylase [Oleiagrimonas sp. C23AA]|uniref:UbiH/UbiF/VisC/COQ6 family ubiquinone biosynthesis hydroxylase n=1 Tax=Oleiagrimonas sp. C23AA TaxID=2719047 RepID=UPI00141FB40A|nr:UbiH/UbiF/VisC/COQ6 family ubiquinone biosynthesis hydroxylase [Oleiagrimonas sp. C23AA]NII09924.1 UbiH/UbiF/VisC/COQ6 family ubiquinone biosynthesis hydroxylase [Oleiagrimonas sp. C23AA]
MSGAMERPRRRRADALDVVVAGGGMAGAATALSLAREGFAVALVEARQPRPWGPQDELDLRVVALAPSSAHLLSRLGVWDALTDARASGYSGMHVWDAESGASLSFDAAERGQSALGWIVENRLVQHVLWQALEAAGVRVECPQTVTTFQAREHDMAVTLDDERVLSTQLLVAADGAASPLRDMAGIEVRGRGYAQRAVVAHVTTEREHQATAWQRFLPGGPIALLPLADGRSSIVWSMPEADAEAVLALDDQAFCDAVGVASDFRLGRVTATSARAAFPLRLQLARSYQAERMVLLGDAAHVVHPLAGQGVNLGLRDVAELRDVLVQARDAGRDIAAEHVLRRYARRRRSADTLDALSFDALSRAFAHSAAPWVGLRGMGVRLLDRAGPFKRLLASHAAGR